MLGTGGKKGRLKAFLLAAVGLKLWYNPPNSAKSAASIADFEKSLDELEKLVHDLEQGELSLEQSLTAFERGVKLTRECQQALKTAEQRVEQLVENSDGTLETRPFSPDEPA